VLDCQLSIRVEEPFVRLVAEDWLRRAVELTLVAAGLSSPVELGLVIADDDTLRELNRSYRGVDNTTDVLAFAFSQPGNEGGEHFITPPDKTLHLGEIFISYRQAERQAEEQHHPLERELALLVIHGTKNEGYGGQSPGGNRKRMKLVGWVK